MSEETKGRPGERSEHAPPPLDPEEARRGKPEADPDALVAQDEPVKDQGDELAQ